MGGRNRECSQHISHVVIKRRKEFEQFLETSTIKGIFNVKIELIRLCVNKEEKIQRER